MSSLGFSIGPSLAKHAYESGANPLGVMTARFTIASLIMLVFRQIRLRDEPFPKIKIILEIFAIGILGITTVSFAYFLAIESIDTGLAIVLWYCNPLIVVLMSWLFLKKTTNPRHRDLARVYVNWFLHYRRPNQRTFKWSDCLSYGFSGYVLGLFADCFTHS